MVFSEAVLSMSGVGKFVKIIHDMGMNVLQQMDVNETGL